MKVVIDTNVLISAAFRDKAPEEVILFIAAQSDFKWIVTTEILNEYLEVLGRKKFGLPDNILRRWVEILKKFTVLVEVDVPVSFIRDQKDAKFLACSLAVGADWLITGDHDFTQAEKLVNTTIISVLLSGSLSVMP